MNKTMKNLMKSSILAAVLLAAPVVLQAQEPSFTGHYVPGVEGIKGATLPPPGFYIRNYNVFYYANRLNDGGRDRVPGDFRAFVYANLMRGIWITDWTFLGGNVGMDAILPIVYTDLTFPDGSKDSKLGVGDIFFEPITLSWHQDRYSAAFGYSFFAPTGSSKPGTARPGKGFWTHMLTGGVTLHLDEEKTWSLSLLNRYEFNTREDESNIRPGQVWTLEYGLGKTLTPTIEAGLSGYCQIQTTRDSGTGASNVKDQIFAAGPEIVMFCPRLTLFASLRYAFEFRAKDRPQGHTTTLTLTKPF